MQQIGFKGRVIAVDSQRPLAGFGVSIAGRDLLGVEHDLVHTRTSGTGAFNTLLFPYFDPLSTGPDVVLRVFDAVGRLVFESAPDDLLDMPFQLNDIELLRGAIVIPEDVADGYRVTLRLGHFALAPNGSPTTLPAPAEPYPGLSGGNTVRLLVDNENAWGALSDALQAVQAGEFIHLAQLWFDMENARGQFHPTDTRLSKRLGRQMLDANAAPRQVPVRLCLNDYWTPGGTGDSIRRVQKYLGSLTVSHTVELRGIETWPGEQLHAKFVVVGNKAFVLGSPLIQAYFDDQGHNFASRRRGKTSAEDATENFPMHDVSAMVEGPAAQLVNRCFVDLWNHSPLPDPLHDFSRDPFAPRSNGRSPTTPVPPPSQAPLAMPAAPSSATSSQREAVQVVRTLPTLPPGRFATAPDGERGILEAYLRAIGQARQFIFFDNQYFTEQKVVAALAAALLDPARPHLEVILIFNPRVDIPGYQGLEAAAMRSLIARLKGTPGALQRLGLFSLWSHGPQAQPGEAEPLRTAQHTKAEKKLIRIYTHAKAAVVDDVWATIGSANLDGASLTKNQILLKTRSAIEVNLLFFDGVDGLPQSDLPSRLRRTLWAEHLGLLDGNGVHDPWHADLRPLTQAERENGGWLRKLWIPAAQRKLASLKAANVTYEHARVLQWPPTPEGKQFWWEADDPLATWVDSDLLEKGCLFKPTEFFNRLGIPRSNFDQRIELRTVGPSYLFDPGQWESEGQ